MKKVLAFVVVSLTAALLFSAWIFIRIYQFSVQNGRQGADAIIVLGAAQYDGTPSPVLKARLDHALLLYNEKRAPLIITTGGGAEGEKTTEAGSGKKYLIEQGVPEKAVIIEDQSLTTKQNLMRVADIAREKEIKTILLVSDPFHMYRSALIAESLDLQAFTSPTKTSPISKNTWLTARYMAREFGLIIAHVLFDA